MQSDLVGFREENVLQISGFYKADVQINYLAELITDKAVGVRESVVQMLREFMTEMGDRYDHQTRYSTVQYSTVQYSTVRAICYFICALYSTALLFFLYITLLSILCFATLYIAFYYSHFDFIYYFSIPSSFFLPSSPCQSHSHTHTHTNTHTNSHYLSLLHSLLHSLPPHTDSSPTSLTSSLTTLRVSPPLP